MGTLDKKTHKTEQAKGSASTLHDSKHMYHIIIALVKLALSAIEWYIFGKTECPE